VEETSQIPQNTEPTEEKKVEIVSTEPVVEALQELPQISELPVESNGTQPVAVPDLVETNDQNQVESQPQGLVQMAMDSAQQQVAEEKVQSVPEPQPPVVDYSKMYDKSLPPLPEIKEVQGGRIDIPSNIPQTQPGEVEASVKQEPAVESVPATEVTSAPVSALAEIPATVEATATVETQANAPVAAPVPVTAENQAPTEVPQAPAVSSVDKLNSLGIGLDEKPQTDVTKQ